MRIVYIDYKASDKDQPVAVPINMRTAAVDFNARDQDGMVAALAEDLVGAYADEHLELVDPDGELLGEGIVQSFLPGLVMISIVPNSIHDRPVIQTWGPISAGQANALRKVMSSTRSTTRTWGPLPAAAH